jgi:Mn2+/Fe2+ NRAMP family transporter
MSPAFGIGNHGGKHLRRDAAVFLAAGLLHAVVTRGRSPPAVAALAWLGPSGGTATATATVAAAPASLSKLFFVFLKVGAVVFGSGYVLLAFLRADPLSPFVRPINDAHRHGRAPPSIFIN